MIARPCFQYFVCYGCGAKTDLTPEISDLKTARVKCGRCDRLNYLDIERFRGSKEFNGRIYRRTAAGAIERYEPHTERWEVQVQADRSTWGPWERRINSLFEGFEPVRPLPDKPHTLATGQEVEQSVSSADHKPDKTTVRFDHGLWVYGDLYAGDEKFWIDSEGAKFTKIRWSFYDDVWKGWVDGKWHEVNPDNDTVALYCSYQSIDNLLKIQLKWAERQEAARSKNEQPKPTVDHTPNDQSVRFDSVDYRGCGVLYAGDDKYWIDSKLGKFTRLTWRADTDSWEGQIDWSWQTVVPDEQAIALYRTHYLVKQWQDDQDKRIPAVASPYTSSWVSPGGHRWTVTPNTATCGGRTITRDENQSDQFWLQNEGSSVTEPLLNGEWQRLVKQEMDRLAAQEHQDQTWAAFLRPRPLVGGWTRFYWRCLETMVLWHHRLSGRRDPSATPS